MMAEKNNIQVDETDKEELFDLAAEYDAMLQQGLSLSGESKEFFIRGRLTELRKQLPDAFAPDYILDFGCGTGTATQQLAVMFPSATIYGLDTAENAIAYARQSNELSRVIFCTTTSAIPENVKFALCHVNGVFHHIPPKKRSEVVQIIGGLLEKDAYFAFFENNPWNPGTRMVMSRIPFDRDAVTLSPLNSRQLLSQNGFRCEKVRFLFYFPRQLARLRRLEQYLLRFPLGAQYLVLSSKLG